MVRSAFYFDLHSESYPGKSHSMEPCIRAKVFQLKVPGIELDQGEELATVRYRSTPDYVEMAMIPKGATAEELNLRPPAISGKPDFAIRVNRALLGRFECRREKQSVVDRSHQLMSFETR